MIAVDPHKAAWTAAAVDASLQPLASIRVPVGRDGYRALRRYARRWPDVGWAIEGATGVGARILEEVASQQVVGSIQGLPVVTDPNIETNLGTGGDDDPVYVLRACDVVLWESGIRARVLPETKAQNLTVPLQLYGYLAFSAAHYPQSGVEIAGLTAPRF